MSQCKIGRYVSTTDGIVYIYGNHSPILRSPKKEKWVSYKFHILVFCSDVFIILISINFINFMCNLIFLILRFRLKKINSGIAIIIHFPSCKYLSKTAIANSKLLRQLSKVYEVELFQRYNVTSDLEYHFKFIQLRIYLHIYIYKLARNDLRTPPDDSATSCRNVVFHTICNPGSNTKPLY